MREQFPSGAWKGVYRFGRRDHAVCQSPFFVWFSNGFSTAFPPTLKIQQISSFLSMFELHTLEQARRAAEISDFLMDPEKASRILIEFEKRTLWVSSQFTKAFLSLFAIC